MMNITASLISNVKATATKASTLVVNAVYNYRLKFSEVVQLKKAKAVAEYSTTKALISVEDRLKLTSAEQLYKTRVEITTGVFIQDGKTKVDVEVLSRTSAEIAYVSKSKALYVSPQSNIKATIVPNYTSMEVYFSSTLANITTPGKIKPIYEAGAFIGFLDRTFDDIVNPQDLTYFTILKETDVEEEIVLTYDEAVLESNKVLLDTANILEDFTRVVQFNPGLTDTSGLNDTIGFTSSYNRQLQDSYSVSDGLAVGLNSTLPQEVASVTDTFTYTVTFDLFDTFNLPDIVDKIFQKPVSEIVSWSDQFIRVVAYARNNIENINLPETVSLNITKPVVDAYNITDEYIPLFNKIVVDPVNTSDIFIRVVEFNRDINDSIATTDDIGGSASVDDNQYFTYFKGIPEQYGLADLPVFNIQKLNSELLNLGDLQEKLLTKTQTETTNISDVYSRIVIFERSILDTNNISDIFSVGYGRPEVEVLNITDLYSSTVSKNTSDTLNTPDIHEKEVFKNVADTYRLSDSYISQTDKVLTDSSNFLEIVVLTLGLTKQDQYNVEDLLILSVAKQPVDIYNISDTFYKETEFNRNQQEYVNYTDTVSKVFDTIQYDEFTIQETLARQVNYNRLVSDTLSISETYETLVNYSRNILETTNIFEAIEVLTEYLRDPVDTTNIVSINSKVLQKPLEEVYALSDLYASLVNKPQNEILSITDTTQTVVQFNRAITDFISTSDTLNGSASVGDGQYFAYFKNIVDQRGFLDQLSVSIQKPLADSYSINDISALEVIKPLIESTNYLDTLNLTVEFYRDFEENTSIFEILTTTVDFIRAVIEEISIPEVFEVSYLSNQQEPITLTDTFISEIDKGITDPANFSDSVLTVTEFFKELSDDVNLVDDINGAAADDSQNFSYFKNLVDYHGIVDLLKSDTIKVLADSSVLIEERIFEISKNITDIRGVGDSLERIVEYNRDIIDTSTITDTLSQAVGYIRLYYEEADISDALNYIFTKIIVDEYRVQDSIQLLSNKQPVDPISIADSIIYNLEYYRDLSDQVAFSEDTNGAAADDNQNFTYFKGLTDQAAPIDLISNRPTKVVLETYNIEDAALYSVGKALTDSASLQDLLTTELVWVRVTTDQYSISDSISFSNNYFRQTEDTYQLVDNTAITAGKIVEDTTSFNDDKYFLNTKVLTDSYRALDTINFTNVFFRTISEVATVSETINFETVYIRETADSYQILDSALLNTNKDSIEYLNISDYSILDIDKQNLDTLELGEQHAFSIAISFSDVFFISEYIGLYDKELPALEFSGFFDQSVTLVGKNLTEQTSLSDNLEYLLSFDRTLVDSLNIEETVSTTFRKRVPTEQLLTKTVWSVYNQDYASDYFADGYLGEGTTYNGEYYSVNTLNKEVLSLSDYIELLLSTSTDLLDNLSLSELVSIEPSIYIIDSLENIVDFIGLDIVKNLVDIVNIPDEIFPNKEEPHGYLSSYQLSDLVSLELGTSLFDEYGNIQDTLVIQADYDRDLSEELFEVSDIVGFNISTEFIDELSIQDLLITGGLLPDQGYTDGSSIVDEKIVSINKASTDTASISEEVLLELIFGRGIADSLGLGFNTTVSNQNYSSDYFSSNYVGESVYFDGSTYIINRLIFDQVNLGDAVNLQGDGGGMFTGSSLPITDIVSNTLGVVLPEDAYSIEEYKELTIYKNILDQLNLSDLVSIGELENTPAYSDYSSIIDLLETILEKFAEDTFALSEGLIFEINYERQLLESTNINSSGTISNQNYVADYFLEGYVGTLLTI